MEIKATTCYLSLGSNLGDKVNNVLNAINQIARYSSTSVCISRLYETEPLGFISNHSFINCCAQISTTLSVIELLDKLQTIEKELGRNTKSKNQDYQDRLIDIDIIFFGDEVIQSEKITIPHALYKQRGFVLNPLSELCPNKIDPVTKISVLQYKDAIGLK